MTVFTQNIKKTGSGKSKLLPVLTGLTALLLLSACGKKDAADPEQVIYDIVDGKVVQVSGDAAAGTVSGSIPQSESREYTLAEAGSEGFSTVNEGTSYLNREDINSVSEDTVGLIDSLKIKLETAADACREIYRNADKGTAMNVSLSLTDVGAMVDAIGGAGYPAADSNGDLNMRCYESLQDFGERIAITNEDIKATYFTVYPDGHLTGFMLSRESGAWYLYSSSMAWNDDLSIRIYSEGRYNVGSIQYTAKGWLIYSRDTAGSDGTQTQTQEPDSYVMVRVLPYNSELKALCQRYVEPVGYLENNLFTTTWNQNDFSVIDFNSLYAYLFGMYHGTDMLSSYNIRSYYKAVQGTKMYLIPTEEFENITTVYFNIDRSALKNISDYSSTAGGYFFLGYNAEYYNATPKTPSPEVVSSTVNADGSITMVVDAVSRWYGTDRVFRHELTVMPGSGAAFKYVSNKMIDDEGNILPKQKLSELLNVELSNTTYSKNSN